MAKSQMLTQKGAEELSVQAMEFLVSEPEHLAGFLSSSGLTPATLRDAMQEPHFLREVMQYLIGNESLLLSFSAHVQFPPQIIANAAQLLGCHFE